MNYQNEYFLQSTPFRINFAGFESDTLKLQNNGWALAIEDHCDFVLGRHEVRFILRHQIIDLYALTSFNSFEFSDLTDHMYRHKDFLRFNIQVMSKDIRFSYLPEFRFLLVRRHSLYSEDS